MRLPSSPTVHSNPITPKTMLIEYKICFQGENSENWNLLTDAALPSVDSIIYFDGDYWEVTDVIHYPSRSAEPKTYLIAPHVLVTKVSSPLHASNQKAKAIAPAAAVKDFRFSEPIEL